jgi:hypothetical protein
LGKCIYLNFCQFIDTRGITSYDRSRGLFISLYELRRLQEGNSAAAGAAAWLLEYKNVTIEDKIIFVPATVFVLSWPATSFVFLHYMIVLAFS